jgi:hypothetical protein
VASNFTTAIGSFLIPSVLVPPANGVVLNIALADTTLTPKALFFFLSRDNGINDPPNPQLGGLGHYMIGMGLDDGVAAGGTASATADFFGADRSQKMYSDGNSIVAVREALAFFEEMAAKVTALYTGGFDVTIGFVNAAMLGCRINYLAFCGSDLLAKVKNVEVLTRSAGPMAINGIGFKPVAVLALQNLGAGGGGTGDNGGAHLGFGFAAQCGLQARTMVAEGGDGYNPTKQASAHSGRLAISVDPVTKAMGSRISVASFDNDGMTINLEDSNPDYNLTLLFLGGKISAQVGRFEKPASLDSGGQAIVTTMSEPQGAIFLSIGKPATAGGTADFGFMLGTASIPNGTLGPNRVVFGADIDGRSSGSLKAAEIDGRTAALGIGIPTAEEAMSVDAVGTVTFRSGGIDIAWGNDGGSPLHDAAGGGDLEAAVCTDSTPPPGIEVPGWFVSLIFGAGATNCFDPAILGAVEGTLNGMGYTLQRNSSCEIRGRLYYQPNASLWRTFCGKADAGLVAIQTIDVARSDAGWTWVVR